MSITSRSRDALASTAAFISSYDLAADLVEMTTLPFVRQPIESRLDMRIAL